MKPDTTPAAIRGRAEHMIVTLRERIDLDEEAAAAFLK
jgi:hypothetical protein